MCVCIYIYIYTYFSNGTMKRLAAAEQTKFKNTGEKSSARPYKISANVFAIFCTDHGRTLGPESLRQFRGKIRNRLGLDTADNFFRKSLAEGWGILLESCGPPDASCRAANCRSPR